ncbi:hypothetical protein [Marinibactrum halimedae]|uniref:Uncharacterized protein n=1 Tax=Marinibactrum halimedae TaxID=1444977 RepID=A0AA37WP89_9GAMM|nr:hypothetical protein [Marinibactrum halimedae]MCD9459504.1 hypothetical protein [Marinibactrum halimedae]GLS28158.1 hypothetical protein GCM10007877_38770 [Marinibactrum halimedae]
MNQVIYELSEAVVFFDGYRVLREMLFSEFEAVLDGFIPLSDMASECATAVYVRIDEQLQVRAAVFFLIPFDSQGFPKKCWNIPLQRIADEASIGPDLGGGPIRLACYTQCPISLQQPNLWDPEMSPGRNHFVLLKKCAERNRLGLTFEEEPPTITELANVDINYIDARKLEKARHQEEVDALKAHYQQAFRNRLAGTLRKQRLRAATLRNRHQRELEKERKDYQQHIEALEASLKKSDEALESQLLLNQSFQEKVTGQEQKIEGIRSYFEEKLRTFKNGEDERINTLKFHLEQEKTEAIEEALEQATQALMQQLQLRDVELMYRKEQEAYIRQELQQLREEHGLLLKASDHDVVESLHKVGVDFVVYQPGLGPLSIPKSDISHFLINPAAFLAEKCGIDLAVYRSWQEHYESPCCKGVNEDGTLCGQTIKKIISPLEFHPGQSDRCDVHQEPRHLPLNVIKL